MERIKTLLARYSQTAFLFFIGLILIVYLALGILYLQQAPQQQDYQDKIDKLNAILKNPLPSVNALNAEYAAINQSLAPMADNITIAMLVSLAEKSGIDTEEGGGKFQVPIASHGSAGSYQVVSFRGIQVQGDPDKVMAFIRVLDSDEKLETLESTVPRIVTRSVSRLVTDDVDVIATGTEGERRKEFRSVIDAVIAMMKDNNLMESGIPNPMSVNQGRASNNMGDDPQTPAVKVVAPGGGITTTGFEGFPDITTTAAGKTYTGNATPQQGYLLYQHDKISSANTTLYTTVDYFPALSVTYYYTAEKDGTVRQWSGLNLAVAKEYPDSRPTKPELRATVDINIYFTQETKPK